MAAHVGKWLLMPLHAASIFTSTKSFNANPVIGNPDWNRRGLHVWRTKLAFAMAERRRKSLSQKVAAADRADYERDGFIARQELLSPEAFAELREQLAALREPAREMTEGNAVTRRIAITPEILSKAPALKALFDTPEWRHATRFVSSFDIEPVAYIQTIFSNADTGKRNDPQTALHMDTFHPTMKAWFFMHDVADDEGPFTYVPGSHRLSPRRLAWQKRQSVLASSGPRKKGGAFRLKPSELKYLHWPQPTRFAVPGNTMVIGDTTGFHARAASNKPTVRLEIYAYSRPNPFNPFAWLGADKIPGLRHWRLPLYYAFHDTMVRTGFGRNVWKKVGPVSPTEPPQRAQQ